MISSLRSTAPAVPYWNVIKGLNSQDKLRLISMLSASLVDADESESPISAHDIYGIWQDDGYTCEELVSEIKECRQFKDDIVEL